MFPEASHKEEQETLQQIQDLLSSEETTSNPWKETRQRKTQQHPVTGVHSQIPVPVPLESWKHPASGPAQPVLCSSRPGRLGPNQHRTACKHEQHIFISFLARRWQRRAKLGTSPHSSYFYSTRVFSNDFLHVVQPPVTPKHNHYQARRNRTLRHRRTKLLTAFVQSVLFFGLQGVQFRSGSRHHFFKPLSIRSS